MAEEDDRLAQRTLVELKGIAKERGLSGYTRLSKTELIERIRLAQGKQYLTRDEIEYIVSDCTPHRVLEPKVADRCYQQFLTFVHTKLSARKVYPAMIPDLKEVITRHYYKSCAQPGDSVGVLAAQSIGERQTQMTLNTFHVSGQAVTTVLTGVPRFVELLNATKNPKTVATNVYFTMPPQTIQEARGQVGTRFVYIEFQHLVQDWSYSNQPKPWYKAFNDVFPYVADCYDHFISYTLDVHMLYLYKIDMREIKYILEDTVDDIQCVYSPFHDGQFDILFSTSDITLPSGNTYITETNITDIFVHEVLHPTIARVHLFGIPGITGLQYRAYDDGWYVELVGYNLHTLFGLEYIVQEKVYSNHVWEIYELLGVEALREFLIQEFMAIISSDSYMNQRHVELLTDMMLFTGNITSISRYGVQRNQAGPLTKSSFEESLEQFLQAGLYTDSETLTGVSAAIMCGRVGAFGSGMCDLVYQQL